MTVRPADLPDFTNPPVTEVALGVQFNSIERFLTPHVGLLWETLREQFPTVEEHPPVAPSFETFGQGPQVGGNFGFHLQSFFRMPRMFFVKRNKTQLLQFQRDRFVHNWRKIGDEDPYPRFETMLSTFETGLQRFSTFLDEFSLGAMVPNQCEVTYINHVPLDSGETIFDAFTRLFGTLLSSTTVRNLGSPEDARILLCYVIRNEDQAPIGRLTVSAEPARTSDRTNIIQLSLTARGALTEPAISAVSKLLAIGREKIVYGFTDITSPAMHARWGRLK